jgi:succinate dehydrogenase / fumarate reductase iron-sulfur subunit
VNVKYKIKRYNPEVDKESHYETYEVELEPTDRVLDGLNAVKWKIDGTLSYRRSCAHGVCGSDAMRINGKNRLACKVLIKDLKQPIVIEPLLGLKVIKDLIVDMEPFFEKYRSVKPYLINDDEPGTKERKQSQADVDKYEEATKCILCAACTASCPSFWANGQYVGPSALVAAYRFIFDSRDKATDERLEIVDKQMGVWRCRTIFNCVEACPREINITRAIGKIKKEIMFNKM